MRSSGTTTEFQSNLKYAIHDLQNYDRLTSLLYSSLRSAGRHRKAWTSTHCHYHYGEAKFLLKILDIAQEIQKLFVNSLCFLTF